MKTKIFGTQRWMNMNRLFLVILLPIVTVNISKANAITDEDNKQPAQVGNVAVYTSNSERLKAAKKLLDAGDVLAAKQVLNEAKDKELNLTPTEKGEFDYLYGKVLIDPKTDQIGGVERIKYVLWYFNESWTKYKNINGAVEEGNLRMKSGEIKKDWQLIRDAYQYFLANASLEQKSLHPEVELSLKQVEPYYQADLTQRKKQAKVNAIKAKQHAKQERLDAIKAEHEARQQDKVRQAEAKRIAKVGDGSADDTTCKSYGARPGSEGYINCRIQLSRTKQLVDEQYAAQIRAENEKQAAKADYNRRVEAAQQAEVAQREAALQKADDDATTSAILLGTKALVDGMNKRNDSYKTINCKPGLNPGNVNCTSW